MILHAGRALLDMDASVADSGLVKENTLHLVLRLRGEDRKPLAAPQFFFSADKAKAKPHQVRRSDSFFFSWKIFLLFFLFSLFFFSFLF